MTFKDPNRKLQLWYPVGYGKQPIYTAEVRVMDAVRSNPWFLLQFSR